MPELHGPSQHTTAQRLPGLTSALLGLLLGSALQLQQTALWPSGVYMLFVLLALMGYGLVAIYLKGLGLAAALATGLAFALLALGFTGWRATLFIDSALAPALEGRDIAVSGVVAGLPQPFEGGMRFRFEQDSAQLDGQPVLLPQRLELAWYSGVFGQGDGAADPKHMEIHMNIVKSRGGMIAMLAVTGDKRAVELAKVPTFGEAGVKGLGTESAVWWAIVAETTDKKWIDGFIHVAALAHVAIAHVIMWFDKFIVDGLVNAVAWLASAVGSFTRSFQAGKIQLYVFWAMAGLIIFLFFVLI